MEYPEEFEAFMESDEVDMYLSVLLDEDLMKELLHQGVASTDNEE